MATKRGASITSELATKPRRKRKSEAKYRCPELLAEWLQHVRALDPHVELPDSEDVRNKHGRGIFSEEVSKKVFDECFATFSETYKQELFEEFKQAWIEAYEEGEVDETEIDMASAYEYALDEYDQFRMMRSGLRRIAERYAGIGKSRFASDFTIAILREIPGTSKLELAPIGLAEVIRGAECERIRICAICSHLFWAKRAESKTCSSKCLNVATVRAYRALTDEQRNAKREQRKKNQEIKRDRSPRKK